MRSAATARKAVEALKLIDENKMKSISPTEIARRLGCSRQFADKCLSSAYGKPLHKAIEESRMQEAQRLIHEGASVRDIVKSMHFTSIKQFHRVYKRYFGHTSTTN